MRLPFILGILHLCLFGTMVTANDAGSGDVIPDITVNEHDGPVTFPQGTHLDISFALDPGSQNGVPHDWWIFIRRNSGPFWWNRYSTGQWIKSAAPIRFSGAALRVVC